MGSIEDFAGRTILLVWYLPAVEGRASHLIERLGAFSLEPVWLIETARIAALLLFCLLICILTVMRRPQIASAKGWEPRISAFLGSFLLVGTGLFPSATNEEWKIAATAIMALGVSLSVYCLFFLGRSFSIMATARQLVTRGPYSVVRHPLYACEMLTIGGIMVYNLSLPTAFICLATVGLQFRRMHGEERVLREAFPEYEVYASRVPRIVPYSRSLRQLVAALQRRKAILI